MKEDFKHSDQNLREKLGGMRMTPPADAWTGIQSGIAKGKTKKRGFYFWFTLLLIVIGTTTGILYFLNADEKTSTKHFQHQISESSDSKLLIGSERKIELYTKNELSIREKKNSTQTHQQVLIDKTTTDDKNLSKSSVINNLPKTFKRVNRIKDDKVVSSPLRKKKNALSSAGLPEKNEGVEVSNSESAEQLELTKTFDFNNSDIATSENLKHDATSSNHSEVSQKSFLLATIELSPLEENIESTLSQNNLTIPKFRKGGISAELGFGASSFRYSATNTASPGLSQYLKDAQSAQLSLNGFARVNYHLNPWFSVHSGVEIQQQNHTIQYTNTSTSSYWTADTVGYYFDSITQQQLPIIDSNYITETTLNPQQFQNRETFVSISFGFMVDFPVGIRTEIGVSLSGVLGIRTKASGSTLTDENNNSIPIELAYKSTGNLTMRLSLRYAYALTEKNFIYFEPYFGFGLNNRSKPDLPYDTRYSNSGIRFGFRRNF